MNSDWNDVFSGSHIYAIFRNISYKICVYIWYDETLFQYLFRLTFRSCHLCLFLLQVFCDRWPGENKHSRINEKYAHCNVMKKIVGLHWGRNVPINTSCCNFSNWWQICVRLRTIHTMQYCFVTTKMNEWKWRKVSVTRKKRQKHALLGMIIKTRTM